MILPRVKARLQALINRMGYRVERLRSTSDDPFQDQSIILGRCGLEAKVVFDLGAHIGSTVLRYRALFPHATIYAFEPFPESFVQLSGMTKRDRALKAIDMAVSDREGAAALHTYRHEQANSLLPITDEGARHFGAALFGKNQVLEVQTTTLDAFCQTEGVQIIDVLKLDVQGAELAVFVGARRMLAERRVAMIYTETEFAEVYEGQATFYGIREYLAGLGYEMFNLYNLYRGRSGRLVAADALFLREDLAQRLADG